MVVQQRQIYDPIIITSISFSDERARSKQTCCTNAYSRLLKQALEQDVHLYKVLIKIRDSFNDVTLYLFIVTYLIGLSMSTYAVIKISLIMVAFKF